MAHRVLIAGTDTFVGLAAARSLGRQGVEVHGVQRDAAGLGGYSRYCRAVLSLPTGRCDAAEAILRYVRDRAITHVMGATEDQMVLINESRAEMERHAVLLFPPKEIFDCALYKDRTLTLARDLGIEVPQTILPGSLRDLERCSTMRFPVVLKPRHRDVARGYDRVYDLKSDRANDAHELLGMMEAYACGELPMVQEYAPGRGLGVCILMRGGEPVCVSQHLRLHEAPITGGVSVYCRTMPVDAVLLDQSAALLRAMRWEGAAMVEYRYDATTGRTCLMEVNGRLWGSVALAIGAGADFPYLLYRSSFEPAKKVTARPNVYARILGGDTRWLWESLRAGRPPLGTVLDYLRAFRPGTRHYIWAVDDPLPALARLRQRLLPR